MTRTTAFFVFALSAAVVLCSAASLAQQGTTELVSVALDGGLGDNYSYAPTISGSGRFIAFESYAHNLLDAGTANEQIFMRDMKTHTTRLVSVNHDGTGGGDGYSNYCQVSDDGKYVVFSSSSTDLVSPGTANSQIFLRDIQGGVTTLVSVDFAGTFYGDSDSYRPRISHNNRFVVYHSRSSNLVSFPTPSTQIFVRDLQENETILASIAPDLPDGGLAAGNNTCYYPDISGTGRYVVFSSDATNLIADGTTERQIFLRDLQTETTTLVSVNHDGTAGASGTSDVPRISPDGRYVTFESNATDLLASPMSGDHFQVYIRDLQGGTTSLVSYWIADGGLGNDNSGGYGGAMSSNARYIAFDSYATNLVDNDTNSDGDIFVMDRVDEIMTRVNVDSLGNQADGYNEFMDISSTGRLVVFDSYATNLVPHDLNGYSDVFVHDYLGPIPDAGVDGGADASADSGADADADADAGDAGADGDADTDVDADTDADTDTDTDADTDTDTDSDTDTDGDADGAILDAASDAASDAGESKDHGGNCGCQTLGAQDSACLMPQLVLLLEAIL